MSSAIGTLTSKDESAAQGPLFFDKLTMVGDSAYPAGGTEGFQAALRSLRKDNRTVLRVDGYVENEVVGYEVRYTPPVYDTDGTTVLTADKLQIFREDATSGVMAEATDGSPPSDLSALTFTLHVVSK